MTDLVSERISVGLELEFEGVNFQHPRDWYERSYANRSKPSYLRFKNDGSLRPQDCNTEMTFVAPLQGNALREALDHVERVIGWHDFELSWRCGMHAHIDFRGMVHSRAYTAVLMAAVLEPALFAWDGTGRQENKFCQSIVDSVEAYDGGNGFNPTKYASVNLASLDHFGSVEMRFAGGTKDIKRITSFINIGMGIRDVADRMGPREVLLSVLHAPSLDNWVALNMHPLAAEQLVPVLADMDRSEFLTPETLYALDVLSNLNTQNYIVTGGIH